MEFLKDKKILITGGTGSFGQAMTEKLLNKSKVKKIYIFSRDELKQWQMEKKYNYEPRLQFFVGDIRDKDRLHRAFYKIDYIFHAAAQKHVPSCEYNPFEAVKTNINGAENVINAAIDCNVSKVIALSTDKAVDPVNLYGSTKLCMEKLFINGNSYVGERDIKFSVVRYGNVVGSSGSIVNIWKKCVENNCDFPLTDGTMTRFFITLEHATNFVLHVVQQMNGTEIFIPQLPSINITELGKAVKEDCKFKIIGIRKGEKMHESLISENETGELREVLGIIDFNYYIIYPNFKWNKQINKYGTKIPVFNYSSDMNNKFLFKEDIIERNLLNE